MLAGSPITAEELAALKAAGFGDIGARVLRRIEHDRQEIDWRDVKLEKLSFEMAQLRRLKFGKKSEQLDGEQRALFDEAIDADIAAAEQRLKELQARKKRNGLRAQLRRAAGCQRAAKVPPPPPVNYSHHLVEAGPTPRPGGACSSSNSSIAKSITHSGAPASSKVTEQSRVYAMPCFKKRAR